MNRPEHDDTRTGAVPVFRPGSESKTPPAPPPPPQPGSQARGIPADQPGSLQGPPGQQPFHGPPEGPPPPPGNFEQFASAPPKKGKGLLIAAGVGVVALVVAIVLIANFIRSMTPDQEVVTANSEPPSAPAEPESGEDPEVPFDSQSLPAGEQLEQYREEAWNMESGYLDGEWVVQLSSKKEGLEAEGIVWTEEGILDHFENMRSQYPDAVLLWSGDWSSYDNSDFWVIVRSTVYSDSESALDFCRQEGFGKDDCMAKRLFITGAPDDTSEYLS